MELATTESKIEAPTQRFQVGDRVEYRSDTYNQWMLGTVQKVRDNGWMYDLDVKKGAQVSKLRLARPNIATNIFVKGQSQPLAYERVTADSLFNAVDLNHDGVISRSEFQAGLQTHFIESKALGTGTATVYSNNPVRSIGATYPAAPQMPRQAGDVMPSNPQSAPKRPLSRASAVTVRKMVETTQSMLQGLEGDLILRAGFIASCFHVWRCEVKLGHAGRLYRDELGRHHDDWAACLDHHKRSFEAEIKSAAERQKSFKERMQMQKELLLDQWAHGDSKGLLREAARAWNHFAISQKRLKRCAAAIHSAIFNWARGNEKGTVIGCFKAWYHLMAAQLEVRQKEAAMEELHKGYKERADSEAARVANELRAQLQQMEERNHKAVGGMKSLLGKWLFGRMCNAMGSAFLSWSKLTSKKAGQQTRVETAARALLRGVEQEGKANLHCSFLRWKMQATHSAAVRDSEVHLADERRRFEVLIEDTKRGHQDVLALHQTEAQQKEERARKVVEQALLRWELGARNGLLEWMLQEWAATVQSIKRVARARQAVHDSVLQSLVGQNKATSIMCFLNWAACARTEKQARQSEAAFEEQEHQWKDFVERTQAAHQDALQSVEAAKARQRRRAIELCCNQWAKGEEVGLLRSTFGAWNASAASSKEKARAHEAVVDAVLRSVKGDSLGALQTCFIVWKHLVETIQEAERASKEAAKPQADKVMRCIMMVSESVDRVLLGQIVISWRNASLGQKEQLDQQRQQEATLDEMRRTHEINVAKQREAKVLALEALGIKDSHTIMCGVFLAWSLHYLQWKEQRVHAMNQSKLLSKYAEFVEIKRLTKNNTALLSSCFLEWHREYKIHRHELHLTSARSYASQLEHQRTECQEQLTSCYRQIDAITATLQKELKTKEELAKELRTAYDKLREATTGRRTATGMGVTPSTVASTEARVVSRTSSEETLNDCVTGATVVQRLRPIPPATSPAQHWRPTHAMPEVSLRVTPVNSMPTEPRAIQYGEIHPDRC